MELKINLGVNDIIHLVNQLPPDDFEKVKNEIFSASNRKKESLSDFLLNGPVFNSEQIKRMKKARKEINKWRKKEY